MRTVAIYGNSLVISSIGASLQERTDLRVLAVTATPANALQCLTDLHADVVIFDLATAQPELAIELWKAQPGVLLIGIDLTAHQALVLSGQSAPAFTTDDLAHVIEDRTNGLE